VRASTFSRIGFPWSFGSYLKPSLPFRAFVQDLQIG
jgi:hypothetical protein